MADVLKSNSKMRQDEVMVREHYTECPLPLSLYKFRQNPLNSFGDIPQTRKLNKGN